MKLDTNLLWGKIKASESYQKWHKNNDSFQEIAIIKSWCDFEDYDVCELCDGAAELVCLYCYIHFVLDVEFIKTVYEMASDVNYEDFFKVDVENAQILTKMLKH